MKSIIKTFWPFIITIAVFSLLLGYFLLSFDKLEGHKVINQYYNDFGDSTFPYITHIGDGLTAILIILLLFIWRLEYGLLAVIAFAFTAGITHGLKLFVFENTWRPLHDLWSYFKDGPGHLVLEEGNMRIVNSFPSGHTTSAMSIFCILALIIKNRWASFSFALLAILASFSRIYLSQHFAEDVFAGTLIGVLGTLLIYVLFAEKLIKKLAKYPSYAKRTFDILSSSIAILDSFWYCCNSFAKL
jgi:membrane-associated phospholipid phosphatase